MGASQSADSHEAAIASSSSYVSNEQRTKFGVRLYRKHQRRRDKADTESGVSRTPSRLNHDEVLFSSLSNVENRYTRNQGCRRSHSMPPSAAQQIVVAAAAAAQDTKRVGSRSARRSRSNLVNQIGRRFGTIGQSKTTSSSTSFSLSKNRGWYDAFRQKLGSQSWLSSASFSCGSHTKHLSGDNDVIPGRLSSPLRRPQWRLTVALKGKAAREHARQFRELISQWSTNDLHCLVVEYDAALAVRELTNRADCARMTARRAGDDLGDLFQNEQTKLTAFVSENKLADAIKSVTSSADIVLSLRTPDSNESSHNFYVHSQLLAYRSSYFRQLLRNTALARDQDRPMHVELPCSLLLDDGEMLEVRPEHIRLLLLYLYTDDQDLLENVQQAGADAKTYAVLRDYFELGSLNSLHKDLYSLLQSAPHDGDLTLVFVLSNPHPSFFDQGTTGSSSTPSLNRQKYNTNQSASNNANRFDRYRCHSWILASRSAFFRSLIDRQRSRQAPCLSNNSGMLEIELDECVMPRVYAPVLLHAMYTDRVDLSKVIRGCPISVNSLSEVQAIAAGKCQLSPIDEATEIYQIARFLEFELLAQGCEDIIVQHIALDSLLSIYNWSIEPFGSMFVKRHCVSFLCQEFSKAINSPLLFDLEESLLIETLQSDFVQASELDILQTVIRWGEHQLVRRMEDREPNILSGTTHSISRKGVRRSDLSDCELREILANLLPLVRVDFILPPNHQVVVQAQSRGLLQLDHGSMKTSSTAQQTTTQEQPDLQWLYDHDQFNHKSNSTKAADGGVVGLSRDTMLLLPAQQKQQHNTAPTDVRQHRRGVIAQKRARLFMPYYDEAKTQLHKRLLENPEESTRLLCRHPPVNLMQLELESYGVRQSGAATGNTVETCPQPSTSNDVDDDSGSLGGGTHLRRNRPITTPNSQLLAHQQRACQIAPPEVDQKVHHFTPSSFSADSDNNNQRPSRYQTLERVSTQDSSSRTTTTSRRSNSCDCLITGGTTSTTSCTVSSDEDLKDQERRAILPSYDVIEAMHDRINDILSHSETCARAVQCGCAYHPMRMLRLIRLRVLREFGYPDDTLRLLRHTDRYYSEHMSLTRKAALCTQQQQLCVAISDTSLHKQHDVSQCTYNNMCPQHAGSILTQNDLIGANRSMSEAFNMDKLDLDFADFTANDGEKQQEQQQCAQSVDQPMPDLMVDTMDSDRQRSGIAREPNDEIDSGTESVLL